MNVVNIPPEQQAIRDKCFHPSGTFVEFPIEDVETSIPARFEKIVRLYPERIAFKSDSCVTTYNQLNRIANRFARALQESQGHRAQLIALLLEKDVPQIAAMLGVMKAGKFFLILDPSFPKSRLVTMLKQSRAKLLVTNRRNAFLAADIVTPDCQLMQWDTVDGQICDDNLNLAIGPKTLAFINYTSGSTGEPKGLLRNHRMILHNIMLRTNLVHVCAHDRITVLSSGTSNAITNSLLALLNGAGLYSLELKKEGVARLGNWLRDESITIAPMSSPLFRNLCETLNGNNNFPDLRVLRLRSEAVFTSDVGHYQHFFSPKCIFVTGLSSNETGPLADYLLDHKTVVTDTAVPVGYAAPGKEILLLNEDGASIGFDEVGEIAVRSRYLSPGYLRNPQLARSKFKHDPDENGSRIYLTGDMGLRLSDGCLIHTGRKDFRVKVRGYPVDLKEVETTLRAHPSIHDSVITTRANQSGETTLIAYFVTASRQEPSVSELVNFLGQTLPEYMIPGSFVRLEKIPLNPQNKVDRTMLPSPAETRPVLDALFMAPRDEVEQQLAEIWAEVLGIDCVGIHDNFLDLGGHSLTATRIVTRMIEKFHLELPLQALFDAPTVEKMAAVLNRNDCTRSEHQNSLKQTRDAEPVNVNQPAGDFIPFPKEELERSVPERFEKIVRLYPDRIAVKSGNDIITYSHLNAMANRMAHIIVEKHGSKPEAIAILMEQGPRLLAAMLAILKAGKFFVLLDKSSPTARLAVLVHDCQAGLIICDPECREVARQLTSSDSHLLELSASAPCVAKQNPNLNISSNTLAAVIYTSGSTGEPKGVIWAHQNLIHRVMLFTNAYKLSKSDRVSLTTSGTGNAVTIGFLPLLNGATLCHFDVKSHGIKALVNWILEERTSICWFASPLFRNMCQHLTGNEKFADVRILRLASEGSYRSDVELFKQYFSPECLLINGLSNTESGLISLFPVDFDTELVDQEVPVGYPVEDKDILLLDDAGKQVGVNEVGEIAVRSRYLSPGYWQRPQLTASKFKPAQIAGDQRLYLSGDLGLMRPDGCLIHKGRKDFRVKIRGYGVELAEIEKVLNSHCAIGQAVVVARSKPSGDAQLIAYYTHINSTVPTVTELRALLRTQLPDYMIPSTFVMLNELPLTPNGKIDRRALPEAKQVRPDITTSYVAPKSQIEQKLVSIWEEVLDFRPVGVNDHFYDLGGDSLSLTRIISQVLKQFEVEIPLRSLFHSPTIAEMTPLIELQQNDRPRQNPSKNIAASSQVRERQQDSFPLSFSQQRLWFLDQFDPQGCTYNLFAAYHLKGDLNLVALEQSFTEIINRHGALRTVFSSEGGNPVQVVLPNLTIHIPVIDLRAHVYEADRWNEVHRRYTEEAQRPFNLENGPLFRITLLRVADSEYVLLRAVHHIVFDGWSVGVLFRELSELYEALSTGRPLTLAELPIQYADFAKWQKQRYQGERLESQLSYWKTQLENIVTLQLATDRPRQPLQAARGARRYFALSHNLSCELKELSRQHSATLFMTLLAGYQTLLHRYSQQTDIVVGSPVAGRGRQELEQLIGFFLNTVVLRLDLSGNPTFIETIQRTREVCLGALNHQELPFEKLVEELHPDRQPGINPLFQTTFAFQNSPRVSPHLANIRVTELEVEPGIARFDLHLFVEEFEGCLKGYWDYDANLFDGTTIERMLDHFQVLLGGMVVNPNNRIDELQLLTDTEKHQLLVEWNATGNDYPNNKCIHHLFEEQVEKTPDAIALVFNNQQLTYYELNNRANHLAQHLHKVGVGPNALVALCLDRCIEMVVGVLAILKAGGAYLPLDPSYPEERIGFILDDAQPKVVLTHSRFHNLCSSHAGVRIALDLDWNMIADKEDEPLVSQVNPENLAYVIYTSGSTGSPKGVAIQHRALCNHMEWLMAEFPMSNADRVLLKTPYSFDASVWEIFAPLLTGAQLVVANRDGHKDANYLVKAVIFNQITVLQLVPSLLNLLLKETDLNQCTSLKYVFCGGEKLPTESYKQFSALMHCELINLYGPTEACIDATYWRSRVVPSSNDVPIGRPIANTQIYILDTYLNPVPVGVAGELHIGGDGLARGYLNRPELTAEKFIANPFSNEPGARLYKTGDLARYLSDGNIEFLGRIDSQVKIRGFRIELGEIEAVLAQHAAIQQAVVLAREDTPGDKRLVAYIVSTDGPDASVHDLRSYLQQKLPDYMVPSAFMFVDSLPLTPNGKLDRKSLPAPDTRPELEHAFIAPRTPVEEILANIWCTVLKLDKVGIYDNFFHLGGHSLLATQVVSRIRDALKLALPLKTLFGTPTIQGLGQQLEDLRGKQEVTETMQIAPVKREQFSVSKSIYQQ